MPFVGVQLADGFAVGIGSAAGLRLTLLRFGSLPGTSEQVNK
jgi:hypothetical protein